MPAECIVTVLDEREAVDLPSVSENCVIWSSSLQVNVTVIWKEVIYFGKRSGKDLEG